MLIDITPQSLIDRLHAGKIYPTEQINSALNNFFKVENLAALREVALRQTAEEVEAKRTPTASLVSHRDQLVEASAPQAISERLLALITPTPSSQRVVRRAWRSAQRLGAEMDVLWVAKQHPTPEQQGQIDALRRLASVLGAHFLVETGSDIASVTRRVARERGTTYVLMGPPQPQSARQRLAGPALPLQLITALPGVDVRIVADRSQRPKPS